MKRFEFWYDIVCPYAYLASTQVASLEAETGAQAIYRPFLLGGVFRAIGGPEDPNQQMSAAKAAHNLKDMRRWAEHFGVELQMPASHPQRTVLCLRTLLAAGKAPRRIATDALFDAYWVRGDDITRPEVLAATLNRVGLRGMECVERAPQHKDELFQETATAVERGIFGAPSFIVNGELYWGQDRLHFVHQALK